MPDYADLFSNGAQKTVSTALASSLVIYNKPGVLYGITGWVSGSGTVYVLIFDSATVPANANPVVPWPTDVIQLTAPNTFSISIPPSGRYYANGMSVAISTTAPPNFTIAGSVATFTGLYGPIFAGGVP